MPITIDDRRRVEVTVSVGAAELTVGGPTERGESFATDLLRAAEHALVTAKQHPDRFTILGVAEARRESSDRAALVAQVVDAMGRDEFVVHYQPKVRLHDGAVVGAEALVRWEHPRRGTLLPGSFLWAVESANLFGPLTQLVLRDALAWVVGRNRAADGQEPPQVVSVNISLDDLRRERFLDDIQRALDDADADPRRLCLELTEQAVLADVDRSLKILRQLRDAGIAIAIDDFGTGFSSLEHLRLFDIDEIKIDKSFVRGLTTAAADAAIVESVVSLGHRLGLVVTAEGIEERPILEALLAFGCQSGQGYLFSRAVPADRFPGPVIDVPR